MPVFVGHHHLFHNLLYILVSSFHCAIHLRFVWRRVVMFDLKLCAEFSDQRIIEIGTILSDDSLRDTIPTD